MNRQDVQVIPLCWVVMVACLCIDTGSLWAQDGESRVTPSSREVSHLSRISAERRAGLSERALGLRVALCDLGVSLHPLIFRAANGATFESGFEGGLIHGE